VSPFRHQPTSSAESGGERAHEVLGPGTHPQLGAGSSSALVRADSERSPPVETFCGPLESALRHPFLVLLPVLVLVAAAIAIGLSRAPVYSAQARINVGRVDVPAYTLQGVEIGNATLAVSYARAIAAPAVIDPAARAAGVSRARVTANLAASPVPDSTLIQVDANGASSRQATVLANTGSQALIKYVSTLNDAQQKNSVLAQYRKAQAITNSLRLHLGRLKLHHLPDSAVVQSAQLDLLTAQLRSQTLSTRFASGGLAPSTDNMLQLVVPAVNASSDFASMLERLALLGFASGAVLGVALALLRVNRRLLGRPRG